jgi:hypothetical protein
MLLAAGKLPDFLPRMHRMSAKDGIFKVGARRAGLAVLVLVPLFAAGAAAAASTPKVVAKATPPAAKVITPAQRCTALEKQFDDALRNPGEGHNLPAAKKLRAEGGHLCDIGRHAAGALHLSEALAGIGLKPKEPQAP